MNNKTNKVYDYIIFGAAAAAYIFAFIYMCSAYFKNSVLHLKYATPHIVSTIYPIRWDFYTGTPDEPVYRLYEIRDHRLIHIDIRPFVAKFFFGLKRDGKVIASELANIAMDTPFITSAQKYVINMPANGDINNYVHTDTLKYNSYHSANVIYLKGQILMSIGKNPTWEEQRKSPGMLRPVTLIPLNLSK